MAPVCNPNCLMDTLCQQRNELFKYLVCGKAGRIFGPASPTRKSSDRLAAMFGLTASQVGNASALRHSGSGDENFKERGGRTFDSGGSCKSMTLPQRSALRTFFSNKGP